MPEEVKKEVEIRDPQGLLDAYEKAKSDLVALRARETTLQKEVDDLKEANSPEALEKWRDRAIKQSVLAALQGDGVPNPERILKYMKLEGVDYDDKDELTGLDDKLNEVKADFPELFDKKRRAGRQDVNIHGDNPASVSKSTTEAQVDAMFK